MKNQYLALAFALLTLAGCQNEKNKEAISYQVYNTGIKQTQSATPVDHLQVITTDTFSDPANSARHALNWEGTYNGMLPCADCSGIDITLTIDKNGYYILTQDFKDQNNGHFNSHGKFTWDKLGNMITLSEEPVPNQYLVVEDRLIKLDSNGEKVTGDLASFYNFNKLSEQ